MTNKEHDFNDPDPWLALELDKSTYIPKHVRSALMDNNRSRSRQFLLPIVRPLARLSIILVQVVRIILPNKFASSWLLHKTISWGMSFFLRRDTNRLILRHFHIGTQILKFLASNIDNVDIKGHPLEPLNIKDLEKNVFVQHDINIYNFIIQVGQQLTEQGTDITVKDLKDIDFSAIQPFEQNIADAPDTWHNVIDLQTAIEIYTPLFALLLSDSDFWRASNSLQLDETVAIYICKLFGESHVLSMVNNTHPMVPLSTLEAGFRLMLHGLDAENLYGYINHMQEKKS
jgi:hypothetical protein